MADANFLKALKDVYAAIDSEVEKQARGDRSCPSAHSSASMTDHRRVPFDPQPYLLEIDLIHAFLGQHVRSWPPTDGICPFVDAGRCTVYEVRPFDCRVAASGTLGHRWKVTIERLCSEYARSRGMRLVGYPICMYGMRVDTRHAVIPEST
jgi:Fe-S-cluster containining protein